MPPFLLALLYDFLPIYWRECGSHIVGAEVRRKRHPAPDAGAIGALRASNGELLIVFADLTKFRQLCIDVGEDRLHIGF